MVTKLKKFLILFILELTDYLLRKTYLIIIGDFTMKLYITSVIKMNLCI